MKNQAANNGTFIPKPGFTLVQNSVARDWNLSSGALGLYTRIQSYITMENITLTKGSLMERVPEGEYAFNTAWNELKSKGYLFIHVYPGEKGRFVYQYVLRPDNSGWDGAYLFYHDRNGDVKSTNLTRNQTETAEQPAEKASADHHIRFQAVLLATVASAADFSQHLVGRDKRTAIRLCAGGTAHLGKAGVEQPKCALAGVIRDAACLIRMLLTEVVSCQVVDRRLHKGGLSHIRLRNGLVLCQCGQNYVFQSIFIHLSPLSGGSAAGEIDRFVFMSFSL